MIGLALRLGASPAETLEAAGTELPSLGYRWQDGIAAAPGLFVGVRSSALFPVCRSYKPPQASVAAPGE
jgi:hypothetical protein